MRNRNEKAGGAVILHWLFVRNHIWLLAKKEYLNNPVYRANPENSYLTHVPAAKLSVFVRLSICLCCSAFASQWKIDQKLLPIERQNRWHTAHMQSAPVYTEICAHLGS